MKKIFLILITLFFIQTGFSQSNSYYLIFVPTHNTERNISKTYFSEIFYCESGLTNSHHDVYIKADGKDDVILHQQCLIENNKSIHLKSTLSIKTRTVKTKTAQSYVFISSGEFGNSNSYFLTNTHKSKSIRITYKLYSINQTTALYSKTVGANKKIYLTPQVMLYDIKIESATFE